MTTYQQYKSQIAELQNLAETARLKEISHAKEKIHAIMREFDLTIADLGATAKNKPKKERAKVQVKYQDGDGHTWTGRGRAPKWLEGKDRAQFLIS